MLVILGSGANPKDVDGQTYESTIFSPQALAAYTRARKIGNSTVNARMVISINKLRTEIRGSLGISANVQGIDGTAEGRFLNVNEGTAYDAFYILESTVEDYEEFLIPGLEPDYRNRVLENLLRLLSDIKPDELAKSGFFLIKQFTEKYGMEYINNIVYGQKIILVAKLSDKGQQKVRQREGELTVKVPAIGGASFNAKKLLKKFKTEDFVDIHYYVSYSTTPFKEIQSLLEDIQVLADLLDKRKYSEKKTSKDSGQSRSERSDSPDDRQHASETALTAPGVQVVRLSVAYVAEEQIAVVVQSVPTAVSKEKVVMAEKKGTVIRYDTAKYSQHLLGCFWVFWLYEILKDLSAVLTRIRDLKHRIEEYMDAIYFYQMNIEKLECTEEQKKELDNILDRLVDWLDSMRKHQKFFLENWYLLYTKREKGATYNSKKRLENIMEITEKINNLNSRLIKFNRSEVLVRILTASYGTKEYGKRSGAYFQLPEVSSIRKFYFRIKKQDDSNQKISFDVMERGHLYDNLVLRKVSSGNCREIPCHYLGDHDLYIAHVRVNGKKVKIQPPEILQEFTMEVYAQMPSHNLIPSYPKLTVSKIRSPEDLLTTKMRSSTGTMAVKLQIELMDAAIAEEAATSTRKMTASQTSRALLSDIFHGAATIHRDGRLVSVQEVATQATDDEEDGIRNVRLPVV